MLKVFGFVTRNPSLTHDEYRAGHVGYHNSFGRRLNNIRGYLLNVRSNTHLNDSFGEQVVDQLTRGEPDDFDEQWDGWGQLMFDSKEHYIAGRTPARDRVDVNGLEDDEMAGRVGGDFDFLYAGSPFQFHVDEHVAKPVVRPERKLFKLAQFVKRTEDLEPELFRAYWTGRYGTLMSQLPGLTGLIFNLRTSLDVMTDFFPADAEGFTPQGIDRRNHFYSSWDGIIEYWLDDPALFIGERRSGQHSQTITEMEDKLFDRVFYREVDETVAVLPNRNLAPNFYHR